MDKLSSYEQNIYVFAARYAHNRNTGAADMVVNTILRNWDKFDDDTKRQLKKEAHEAVYNTVAWKALIDRKIRS